METVNSLQALVAANEVCVSHCCALVDTSEGLDFLESIKHPKANMRRAREWGQRRDTLATELESEELSSKRRRALLYALDELEQEMEDAEKELTVLCSAVIYEDLFRQVRQWARMGHTSEIIQRELDARYQAIIDISMQTRATEVVGEGPPTPF